MKKEEIYRILYWVFTVALALPMLFSSYMYVTKAPPVLEGLGHLGYPTYLLYILGPAKFLGAIAILVPKFPKIKEWAYAGFTFNLIGAFLSHVFAGDPNFAGPLLFLIINSLSYFLWKKTEAK
jgi:uncharacterized membrane protein YphA (DoxX/SURF4 family)